MTTRGEHVAAVADVLQRYLRKSDSQGCGILKQVGRKLIQLATDTYQEHNLNVREAFYMHTHAHQCVLINMFQLPDSRER